MVPIVEAIVKAYGVTVEFANGMMSSLDEKKFSEAVGEFYGEEPSVNEWDEAIELIKNATDIDTERKVELLKMVSAEREQAKAKTLEAKKEIADTFDEHNEKKAKLAVKVVAGVLTAGASLIPAAVKEIKNVLDDTISDENVIDEKPVEETDNEDTPQ